MLSLVPEPPVPEVPVPSVMTAQKAEFRRRMRMVREIVDDRLLRSVSLWAAVASTEAYERAATVMAFVSVDGEPDTDPLLARVALDGKRVVLPAMDDDRIVPRLIGSGLAPGPFGVPAPQGERVELAELDLVIVPGLAFTSDGRRLGRGGGHYDRLLAALPGSCHTIGVCFVEQLVDELPIEPHDRHVDEVITDA